MELFGYTVAAKEFDAEAPDKMAEISLCGSPDELRRIADFLIHVAAQMEQHGANFGHEHLCDFDRRFRSHPQFVACPPTPGRGR